MSYAPFPLVWGFFGSGGGGGGGGPAFGVIQTDFGTYPTASSTTDVLTFVSADPTKYYFTGTALTDTVTLTVNGLMPTSGTTGQVLKKLSATDYDAAWATLTKSDVGLGNVDNVSLTAQNLATKEPTGFPNRTDSGISFDEFTRTFFIAATGAQFDVWVKGVNYVFPGGLAIGKLISTTSGVHYIYFDSSGNLQETTTFSASLFTDNAMVAIVYWNNTNSTAPYVADERHGMQMDGASQVYLHTVFGTRYLTGLALQNFDPDNNTPTNASAQFTSDSGTIRDEDILHTLASQTQIPILYKSGTLWRKKAADAYPIIYNGTAGYTGTRVPYNQLVSGSWQLTEVTDGNYVMVHLFATNDINSGVVGIMGINEYANAPQARAAADTEINSLSDLPFAEFTAIGTVIFQTQTSYTNTPKARVVSSNPSISEVYIDFRGEQLYTPSGVATSHSLLSNLSSDDHTQYHTDARGDLRYLQLTGGALTGPVTSTSTLGIGVLAPISLLHVSSVNKAVSSTLYTSDYITLSAENTAPGFNIITSSNTAGHRGVFKSTRSRGTLDAPTAVQSGDQTLSIVGAGHDGTTNITTAGITFAVDGTVATSQVPQAITFATGDGATRTERMRINSTGQVGINFIPSSASSALTVKSTAVPSTAESIASFFVTDSSASLNISNASTVDSTFIPSLAFTQATGNTNAASMYQGFITLSDDTGTEPVHIFRAQTQNAGSYAALTTRPLYQWRNWSTNMMTMLANGNLGIGTTTPSEKLDVTGNIHASGTVTGSNIANASTTGFLSNTDWQSFSNRLSYKGSISYVTAVVANITPSSIGTSAPTGTGTSSAVTPTFTSFYTSKKIMEFTASALSSAIAGWRFTTEYVGRGSSAQVGGFTFSTRFGFQAGFASGGTNRRFFCGLTSSTVAPSDVNPSTLGATQDIFGVGLDNGDANFQIMHSAGAANATKVNLGASFPRPTADKDKFYQLDVYLPANSAQFTYTFTELISGNTTSGTISATVPGAGVALSPRCWVSAGGVSSAVGVAMEYIYLEAGA